MTETPLRSSTRLLLAVGILVGLGGSIVTLSTDPAQFRLASDVYYHAADAALSGGDMYETTPPDRPTNHYLYPPVVVLLFVPHALLGGELLAWGIQTVLNLGAGIATAVVIWRALERRGVTLPRHDRTLLAIFVLCSSYGTIQLLNGQITLWLGLALAVGFDALDRRRETVAGTAFALAALLKVFPAAVGLLLIRLRAWRGVVAALATGLGGLLVGALIFGPDVTMTYVEDVLLARFESESVDGMPDPGQRAGGSGRQLAALGVPASLLTPLSLAVVAVPLTVVYRRLEADLHRQAGALATISAVLLFVPLQPLYFPLLVFPLVLLLVMLPSGPARTVLFVGVLLSYVRVGHEQVVAGVEALSLPAALASGLTTAIDWLFTFILPAHLGLWLVMGACVLVAVSSVSSRNVIVSGLGETGGDGA